LFWLILPAALLASGGRALAQSSTQITVDATDVVRTVDERVFGVNTAIWDSSFSDPRTQSLLQAADVRTLRFPGGSQSDTYDWKRNRSYDTTTGVLNDWSWFTDFDAFAAVAVPLKAQVFITVNYGSGTAQDAADWVTYSNVTKQYGFRYWEVGNENYGSWEYDTHAIKWDPVTYATEAKDYIAAMKKADPTIKVGVVVETGEDELDAKSPRHNVINPRTGATHHGWTAVMLSTLKSLGVKPDFVIYHRYAQAPFGESDAGLLAGKSQSGATWADDAANLRQMVNDYLGADEGGKVELVVTENNSVYSNPGKQSTSLVNGLFMADSLGQLLQTEFNSLVWWALRNGPPVDEAGNQTGNFSASLYGWRTYGDYGMLSPVDSANPPTPNYYMMKLLSHFARGGDVVVKATSDNPLLAVYAARRVDGTLSLLVINKSPTATATGSVALNGFVPAGAASVYSYGIPEDDAAKTGTGSPDVALSSLDGVSATFQTSFAPYSAAVIELVPSSTLAPARPVGFASGTTEVTLSWRPPSVAGGGATGYKLERATDSAFTQDLAAFNLDASTSYIDTGVLADTVYYYRLSVVNAGGVSDASEALQVQTPSATGGAASHFVNIATRAYCGTGNAVTIAGFVISGTKEKWVLLRAVGPTLVTQGVGANELLPDPTIELHDTLKDNAIVGTNNNWGENDNAADIMTTSARVGATPFANDPDTLVDTTSSALLLKLEPGIYSLVVRGQNGASGIVLGEVYDADPADLSSSFVNLATRAYCSTGNNVTIGGFVIGGTAYKRVLVRAVGPTLVTQGVGADELLPDPTIELHDAAHGNEVIAINDDAGANANAADIVATAARVGATPFAKVDTQSAALLLTLPPGRYSFVTGEKNGGSGVVLVEVYDAD
jgi:hypothetical protein